MSGNFSLTLAKAKKEDEFYTQITDIEKELKHYAKYFKNKHIFCNCDDPETSSFWRYFALNFNRLGLKRLTSTHYTEDNISYQMDMYKEVPKTEIFKKTFLTLEETGISLPMGYITDLSDNGDFRNNESIRILEECDIVVTNPPFSLFREYIDQLIYYKKNFIVIGNQNAVTYKETFNYLQKGVMWLGVTYGDMSFKVPSHYEPRTTRFWIDELGQKWRSMGNICWYTNLDFPKRHENLVLFKEYYPEEYPFYDNYNIINVNKVSEIPKNYYGVMGVPITFFNKFNPEQFEIVGLANSARYLGDLECYTLINCKKIYNRVLIKIKDNTQ